MCTRKLSFFSVIHASRVDLRLDHDQPQRPSTSPPAVNGVLSMSAQVFTGDVCQVAQKLISLAPLPSQVNRMASNCTLAVPINGSIGRPRPNVPNTVPSL